LRHKGHCLRLLDRRLFGGLSGITGGSTRSGLSHG
jgi:hypothetical protein